MTDDLRIKAVFAELANQRNAALDRCANLIAEIVVLQARVKEFENPATTPEER